MLRWRRFGSLKIIYRCLAGMYLKIKEALNYVIDNLQLKAATLT